MKFIPESDYDIVELVSAIDVDRYYTESSDYLDFGDDEEKHLIVKFLNYYCIGLMNDIDDKVVLSTDKSLKKQELLKQCSCWIKEYIVDRLDEDVLVILREAFKEKKE